jgi:triacylglycerol lipase
MVSRIAYREGSGAMRALEDAGFSRVAFWSGPSTQVLTGSLGGLRYIAFRGSESIQDWLANARFLPSEREDGVKIHTGFLAALDEVWADLAEAEGHAGQTEPLVATGHSLGGALAHLSAWRWAKAGRAVHGVYTFGAPRVGHRDFRSSYDALLGARTLRVINHVDIVTRVPFLIQGYRHVGRRVYGDSAGKLTVDASAWAIARDDVAYRVRHLRSPRSLGIALHLIRPYSQLVDEP